MSKRLKFSKRFLTVRWVIFCLLDSFYKYSLGSVNVQYISTQCLDACENGRKWLFTAAIVEKILRWKTFIVVSILVTYYHGLGRHEITIHLHFYCFCLFNGKIKSSFGIQPARAPETLYYWKPTYKLVFTLCTRLSWPDPKWNYIESTLG